MTTIRTLGFAAVAALSLGFGSAFAQNDGPSTPEGTYRGAQPAAQYRAPANNRLPQSGSSDVNTVQPAMRGLPTIDYGDIDSPG